MSVSCLVCKEKVKYNLRQHYSTKHTEQHGEREARKMSCSYSLYVFEMYSQGGRGTLGVYPSLLKV